MWSERNLNEFERNKAGFVIDGTLSVRDWCFIDLWGFGWVFSSILQIGDNTFPHNVSNKKLIERKNFDLEQKGNEMETKCSMFTSCS